MGDHMPSAAMAQRARTMEPSATETVTPSRSSAAAVTAVPSRTRAPSLRARSTRAASRSARVATAANRPGPRGRGKCLTTPLGDDT